MLTSEFLQPYPRVLTLEQVHNNVELPGVQEAQEYSYGYGLVAHAALRDEREQVAELLPPLLAYERRTDYVALEKSLFDGPNGWDDRTEINFYALNDHMRDMWAPLIAGNWEESGKDRERTIAIAMNSLALFGTAYFAIREKYIRRHGTESLYEERSERFLSLFTGVLQEIDVAIVMLDVIRREPSLTVVPAPMQFGRSRRQQINANLLIVDVDEDRMVGVQTKTTVRKETMDRYDQSRIVVVDGSVDLDNVRAVRTQKGRSTTQVKPWPGIVAASRVDAIQLHGKQQSVAAGAVGHAAASKILARQMVGNLRVDYTEFSSRLRERVLSKL